MGDISSSCTCTCHLVLHPSIESSNSLPSIIHLNKDAIKIGRDPSSCDVHLDSNKPHLKHMTSRHHATIRREIGAIYTYWVIEDKSTHGVFVGMDPPSKLPSAKLSHGMYIIFGSGGNSKQGATYSIAGFLGKTDFIYQFVDLTQEKKIAPPPIPQPFAHSEPNKRPKIDASAPAVPFLPSSSAPPPALTPIASSSSPAPVLPSAVPSIDTKTAFANHADFKDLIFPSPQHQPRPIPPPLSEIPSPLLPAPPLFTPATNAVGRTLESLKDVELLFAGTFVSFAVLKPTKENSSIMTQIQREVVKQCKSREVFPFSIRGDVHFVHENFGKRIADLEGIRVPEFLSTTLSQVTDTLKSAVQLIRDQVISCRFYMKPVGSAAKELQPVLNPINRAPYFSNPDDVNTPVIKHLSEGLPHHLISESERLGTHAVEIHVHVWLRQNAFNDEEDPDSIEINNSAAKFRTKLGHLRQVLQFVRHFNVKGSNSSSKSPTVIAIDAEEEEEEAGDEDEEMAIILGQSSDESDTERESKRKAAAASSSSSAIVVDDEDEEGQSMMASDTDLASIYKAIEPKCTVEAPQPSGLECDMTPYQKRSLAWMLHCETRSHEDDESRLHPLFVERVVYNSKTGHPEPVYFNSMSFKLCREHVPFPGAPSGGLLAEEVGLGKTVECIGLILSNPRPSAIPRTFTVEVWDDPLTSRNLELTEVKATLIVAPTAIVNQWKAELELHSPELSVLLYEGQNATKPKTSRDFITYDVILTTFQTLTKDINFANESTRARRQQRQYAFPTSPLITTKFWRVCLDEAQMIQSTVSTSSKMAMKIPSVHRWCITGTPVSKNFSDLFGIISFLGIRPYNTKFWFLNDIIGSFSNERKRDRFSAFLKSFLWRHSKKQVENEMKLPPQHFEILALEHTPIERDYYNRKEQRLINSLRDSLAMGDDADDADADDAVVDVNADAELTMEPGKALAFMHNFQALRQAVIHPDLELEPKANLKSMKEVLAEMISKEKENCSAIHRKYVRALHKIVMTIVMKAAKRAQMNDDGSSSSGNEPVDLDSVQLSEKQAKRVYDVLCLALELEDKYLAEMVNAMGCEEDELARRKQLVKKRKIEAVGGAAAAGLHVQEDVEDDAPTFSESGVQFMVLREWRLLRFSSLWALSRFCRSLPLPPSIPNMPEAIGKAMHKLLYSSKSTVEQMDIGFLNRSSSTGKVEIQKMLESMLPSFLHYRPLTTVSGSSSSTATRKPAAEIRAIVSTLLSSSSSSAPTDRASREQLDLILTTSVHSSLAEIDRKRREEQESKPDIGPALVLEEEASVEFSRGKWQNASSFYLSAASKLHCPETNIAEAIYSNCSLGYIYASLQQLLDDWSEIVKRVESQEDDEEEEDTDRRRRFLPLRFDALLNECSELPDAMRDSLLGLYLECRIRLERHIFLLNPMNADLLPTDLAERDTLCGAQSWQKIKELATQIGNRNDADLAELTSEMIDVDAEEVIDRMDGIHGDWELNLWPGLHIHLQRARALMESTVTKYMTSTKDFTSQSADIGQWIRRIRDATTVENQVEIQTAELFIQNAAHAVQICANNIAFEVDSFKENSYKSPERPHSSSIECYFWVNRDKVDVAESLNLHGERLKWQCQRVKEELVYFLRILQYIRFELKAVEMIRSALSCLHLRNLALSQLTHCVYDIARQDLGSKEELESLQVPENFELLSFLFNKFAVELQSAVTVASGGLHEIFVELEEIRSKRNIGKNTPIPTLSRVTSSLLERFNLPAETENILGAILSLLQMELPCIKPYFKLAEANLWMKKTMQIKSTIPSIASISSETMFDTKKFTEFQSALDFSRNFLSNYLACVREAESSLIDSQGLGRAEMNFAAKELLDLLNDVRIKPANRGQIMSALYGPLHTLCHCLAISDTPLRDINIARFLTRAIQDPAKLQYELDALRRTWEHRQQFQTVTENALQAADGAAAEIEVLEAAAAMSGDAVITVLSTHLKELKRESKQLEKQHSEAFEHLQFLISNVPSAAASTTPLPVEGVSRSSSAPMAIEAEEDDESVVDVIESEPVIRNGPHNSPTIHVLGDHGTKIDSLVRAILHLKNTEPHTKSLIFSHYRRVLDTTCQALQMNGIKALQLMANVGGRSVIESRRIAINSFKHDPEIRVFALSLQSAASGLTLTAANHIFLLEPLINPGLESQAVARIHRFGQTKTTYVHRLVVMNTVEERMLKEFSARNIQARHMKELRSEANKEESELVQVSKIKRLFPGQF